MIQVEKADWYFILPATIVWVLSIFVSAWDFVFLQGTVYEFGWASTLGVSLFVLGVSLRAVSKRTLNKSYSYVLSSSHETNLITHGVYRFIRHPIYLSSIFYTVGLPLVFSSIYGFLVALCFVPCILYRIRVEESMLIERFGEIYLNYTKKTKKLIPYIY